MSSYTVKRTFHIATTRRSRKVLRRGKEPPRKTTRVPRLSKLMALAIEYDRLIREGHVADMATLARYGQVSRARVTQIMNLLSLAPDIQEEILFLPHTESGRDPIREAMVRPIAAVLDWGKQRGMWREELRFASANDREKAAEKLAKERGTQAVQR